MDKAVGAPFGTVLGMAPGNVPVYSSNYSTLKLTSREFRKCSRNYIDHIFMGYKWQCVEFARRFYYLNKRYVFDDISMAYDIFHLKYVRQVNEKRVLPLYSFENGSPRLPEPGAMLIWDAGGVFEQTGHVAIITEVYPDKIRVVEQNFEHEIWPDHRPYSRELEMFKDGEGKFWIHCDHSDSTILGWVMQTENSLHSKVFPPLDNKLLNIEVRYLENNGRDKIPWSDMDKPEEIAFQNIVHQATNPYRYFCLKQVAERELRHAANELHIMFMHATDYVLENHEVLEQFSIPREIWPKIFRSWNNRRNEMITGRFDFSVSEQGLKIYEYNADSSSTYLECAKIQCKWATHYRCSDGRCAGEDLHRRLVRAWQEVDFDHEHVLHVMHDVDPEETYHALYIKGVIEEAGIICKRISGTDSLSWDDHGNIVDEDGIPIRFVWKTWAWETALDQFRADPVLGDRSKKPRLADVLFKDEIQVIEPLWTVVTSNKALLPILSELYPHHPNLPFSSFSLTKELKRTGYAMKPIVGRCGENIKIVKKSDDLIEETGGNFGDRNYIFQEYCPLPRIEDHNIQIGVFTVRGVYSGANVRMDPNSIVVYDSELAPLRIIEAQ